MMEPDLNLNIEIVRAKPQPKSSNRFPASEGHPNGSYMLLSNSRRVASGENFETSG
jgi:hypothetical protein